MAQLMQNPQIIDEDPYSGATNDKKFLHSDSVKKGDQALSKLSRELSDEDLQHRGTQRLILNELDKYNDCKVELENYKEKYHNADRENAVLKERLKTSTAFEIIYGFIISIGSALIGISPSIKEMNESGNSNTYYLTWIILIIGILSVVGGAIAKIFISKNIKDN